MSLENRLNGEPYLNYLHDANLDHWRQPQKKKFQREQDSRLGKIMYIDYLKDAFFDNWTLEEKEEFSSEQFARLKAEGVDLSKDDRFSTMSSHEKYYIRAKTRRAKKLCVIC
jgi:hypothetical protein